MPIACRRPPSVSYPAQRILARPSRVRQIQAFAEALRLQKDINARHASCGHLTPQKIANGAPNGRPGRDFYLTVGHLLISFVGACASSGDRHRSASSTVAEMGLRPTITRSGCMHVTHRGQHRLLKVASLGLRVVVRTLVRRQEKGHGQPGAIGVFGDGRKWLYWLASSGGSAGPG